MRTEPEQFQTSNQPKQIARWLIEAKPAAKCEDLDKLLDTEPNGLNVIDLAHQVAKELALAGSQADDGMTMNEKRPPSKQQNTK